MPRKCSMVPIHSTGWPDGARSRSLPRRVAAQTRAARTIPPRGRQGSRSPRRCPPLDGSHLKATIVEVRYGPGGSSPAHSHPCAVIGYVIQGALRNQVQGEAAAVYHAGETFYEPPNGVHAVSANASTTDSVRFLAYFTCDRDGPLSVPPRHQ